MRRQEIAIRRALGASTIQIAAHWLTESLGVALLGGIVGVLIAIAGVPLLLRLIPADRPIAGLDNVHPNINVLFFAIAVTLVVAALLGAIPALAASRTSLNEALHQGGRSSTLARGGGWQRWSRRWLYDELGLYKHYRVRRPESVLKANPAG